MVYVHLLLLILSYWIAGTQIRVTPDPPSPRMSWESWFAVASQQLPQLLCGAGPQFLKTVLSL